MITRRLGPLLLILPVLLIGTSAAANGGHDRGHLKITEVFVNFEASSIEITGEHFDRGKSLGVTLGEVGDISDLCVPDFGLPHVIVCDLLSIGMPAEGDYLLTVTAFGNRWKRHKRVGSDEYNLTIGSPTAVSESPGGEDPSPASYVRLNLNAPVSVPNDAATLVSWDSELSDADNLHDPSVDPRRVTIARDGLYQVETAFAWPPGASGNRAVLVYVNNMLVAVSNHRAASTPQVTTVHASKTLNLLAGDALEVAVMQTSGGTVSLDAGGVEWRGWLTLAGPMR